MVDCYVFQRSPNSPSGSPLSSKVELYVRMAGIPHNMKDAMEAIGQSNITVIILELDYNH